MIKEPGRFDIVVMMIVALFSSYGAKALFEKMGKNGHNLRRALNPMYVALIIVIIVLIESNGIAFGSHLTSIVSTSINVPGVYAELASLTQNFSVLQIPTFSSSTSSQPTLYPSKADYYTSISHKPVIGGYAAGANISDELALYNIPIALAAQSLQDTGNFSYTSPVFRELHRREHNGPIQLQHRVCSPRHDRV